MRSPPSSHNPLPHAIYHPHTTPQTLIFFHLPFPPNHSSHPYLSPLHPPSKTTCRAPPARSSWQIMIYLSAISWGVLIVMCLWPPVWTMVPR
jgi:hypothetical protein